ADHENRKCPSSACVGGGGLALSSSIDSGTEGEESTKGTSRSHCDNCRTGRSTAASKVSQTRRSLQQETRDCRCGCGSGAGGIYLGDRPGGVATIFSLTGGGQCRN